jgi:hemoglobin
MALPNRFRNTLAALALTLAGAAGAQTVQPQEGSAAAPTLYQQLGGQAGLVALMDDLMTRLLADPQMKPFFEDVDQKDVKHKLVLQFCDVAGGPCKTKNTDMKETHADQRIRKSDFNRLVEVLQQSMDAQGIAFSAQNQLLAKLAPMHREIINTP